MWLVVCLCLCKQSHMIDVAVEEVASSTFSAVGYTCFLAVLWAQRTFHNK